MRNKRQKYSFHNSRANDKPMFTDDVLSPARLPGEPFDVYHKRRKAGKLLVSKYSSGKLVWSSKEGSHANPKS